MCVAALKEMEDDQTSVLAKVMFLAKSKGRSERGERLILLAPTVVSRLRTMRGPGESYSDVIVRLAEADTCAR